MWRAAMRMEAYAKEGWRPTILHFGDHDPSGIDMTRDIRDRLAVFGADVDVDRLALNMDQVDQYSPPPNPAKKTDARFKSYMVEFGAESWELDALDPDVLAALVQEAVKKFINPEKWHNTIDREIEERALLKVCANEWEDISGHITEEYPDAVKKCDGELADSVAYKNEREALDA
jgi:hypothetical protein